MYLDSDLKIEIISSLLGQTIKPYDKKRRGRKRNILSVDEFHLHNLIGRQKAYGKEPFINAEEFFDPDYDCDFTNVSDSAECTRGDELYERPKGWYRMALKVKGKYPDGDTWLGTGRWRDHSVPGEWPVSYHGTSLTGAKGIIRSHYSAGDGALYGRGIYSTPDIHVAEREEYAKTFTSKTTGKSYKVILQNRINPKKREICQRFDYWLIHVPEGASAREEKKIVESSIRPYGILIREINDDGDGDGDGHKDGGGGGSDDGHDDGDDDNSDDDNTGDDKDDDGDNESKYDESNVGDDYDDEEGDDYSNDSDNEGDDDDSNDDDDDGSVDDKFDDDENGSSDDDDDDEERDDDGRVDDRYDDDENGSSDDDDDERDDDGRVDDRHDDDENGSSDDDDDERDDDGRVDDDENGSCYDDDNESGNDGSDDYDDDGKYVDESYDDGYHRGDNDYYDNDYYDDVSGSGDDDDWS